MTTIVDCHGNPISAEDVKENEETTTATVTEEEQQDKNDILFVPTPVFILFAEYLGFVSYFVTMAEDWCNPKKPLPSKQIKTLLEREAKSIYDEMLETWSEDDINKLYHNFYPCGLDELEEDLKEKNDLPF